MMRHLVVGGLFVFWLSCLSILVFPPDIYISLSPAVKRHFVSFPSTLPSPVTTLSSWCPHSNKKAACLTRELPCVLLVDITFWDRSSLEKIKTKVKQKLREDANTEDGHIIVRPREDRSKHFSTKKRTMLLESWGNLLLGSTNKPMASSYVCWWILGTVEPRSTLQGSKQNLDHCGPYIWRLW